jgi:hypothetical protein
LRRINPVLALLLIVGVLTLLLIVSGRLQAEEHKWVLLPPSQANAVTRLCSRNAAAKVDRGWQVTTKDADAIEDALAKDSYLRGKLTSAPTKENDPRQYYRQYVGVVVGGRKLIYVNGICVKPSSDWTRKLEDFCDGGACFWGVLYDPASGEFSQFEMNGVA